jgi:hypothetical protein
VKREAEVTRGADEDTNNDARAAHDTGGGTWVVHGMVIVSEVPATEEG